MNSGPCPGEEFVKHCSRGGQEFRRFQGPSSCSREKVARVDSSSRAPELPEFGSIDDIWMSKDREIVEAQRLKKLQEQQSSGAGARRSSYSMLGSQAPLNTITPCAACKLLRRRCAQECPFAPYFSPHEPQKFAAVHKVFGASNVSKMLSEVPESQRSDVANSLVYEANARIRDPVYGCTGTISALQQQAQSLQAELNAMREEILRYRVHENAVAAVSLVTSAMPAPRASSGDYVVASSSNVEAPDVKERYW